MTMAWALFLGGRLVPRLVMMKIERLEKNFYLQIEDFRIVLVGKA